MITPDFDETREEIVGFQTKKSQSCLASLGYKAKISKNKQLITYNV